MSQRTSLENNKKDVVPVEISYYKLDENIDFYADEKHKKDMTQFLGALFNIYDIGMNAKKIINPELDYVVKFTPELLKKMEEHDIRFLADKITGELLPDLYDYTEKHIGGKVRLVQKGNITTQDYMNFHNSLNNMIEQQRYEALIEEVRKLHLIAKRIERGQDRDRFAKVNAGRKHLLDALNFQGSEEEKRQFVFDALQLLREGRELIELTLIEKMNEIEKVPEKKLNRLWKCFSESDYYENQTSRYEDIQEYFQYYYLAIQPIAYAYTYLNQPQLIENLLEDSRKVFEHKNLCLLSTIEYLHPNKEFKEMWYKKPQIYEKRLLESYKERKESEDLYITVKGKEILEVIENEER